MMKEPWFWRDKSFAGRAIAASLAPGAFLYDAARRWREANIRPAAPPVPVLCVGNATLGGVGKTPFALMLAALLREKGVEAHFLTRGYGGAARGPLRIDPSVHDARAVGDEALLLAAQAPTFVARDRVAGAHEAAKAGAKALIMDDGYQNPSLKKTLSILLTDADDPYGNGRLFPAGPLREPIEAALARADICVCVARGRNAAAQDETGDGEPCFRAWLEPARPIPGHRLVAFAGIGRPQRFFEMLKGEGAEIIEAVGFPDHHPYSETEIARLKKIAAAADARLVTTEKDFVRLPPAARENIDICAVNMVCDDPARLSEIALSAIARFYDERKPAHG